MPNTANPNISEWVSTLDLKVEDLNENTYFIGLSIGCQTIMRYLENKMKHVKLVEYYLLLLG